VEHTPDGVNLGCEVGIGARIGGKSVEKTHADHAHSGEIPDDKHISHHLNADGVKIYELTVNIKHHNDRKDAAVTSILQRGSYTH